LAKSEQIVAAPTLIKKLPLPLRRLIGDMADEHRVLVGLTCGPGTRWPPPSTDGLIACRPSEGGFEMTTDTVIDRLTAENAELRARLEEAEDALRAIREGEVDAVIVSGSQGDRVFSLMETENLHRLMVETMNEAGLAISPDGLLLYANDRATALLKRRRSHLLGHPILELVAPHDSERLRTCSRHPARHRR
jgi:PAS domain-containing protein